MSYGLLGRKLGHSYSPRIHELLCERGGISYDYSLFETEPEGIKEILSRDELCGFNVTIPYKQTVLAFCDVISDEVLKIGAANTLVKRDGKLCAYNTDLAGFRYMVYASGIKIAGKKVLVLGSGGASKAVICALSHLGAKEIITISRTGKNNYENIHLHSDTEIIVNTTPVGMYPDNFDTPLDIRGFPRLCGVLDLVYNPSLTGILLSAEALGVPHLGGLHMLVAQAKASYELFTGTQLPDSVTAETVRMLSSETENIVLIGMPGCGKTTIGEILSNELSRELIDTDREIEKKTGMSIPEFFKRYGEGKFRETEREVIREVGKLSGKILSLGGGAVLNRDNYAPLHQNGKIFFIDRATELLATKGRPLSKSPEALKEMHAIRLPIYRDFCDCEILNDGTPAAAAELIIKKL